MSEKNKNNNAKSTIIVCLIGAVVLMGVLMGRMIERFNMECSNCKVWRG